MVRGNLEPTNLVMLYLAAVVIAPSSWARASLLASVPACWPSISFLFPPYLTFAVSDTQYLMTFIGLFVVSLVVST